MTIVGFAIAPWLHTWFGLLERIVPPLSAEVVAKVGSTGVLKHTMKRVAVDQLTNAPIVTALFFLGIGALEGNSFDEIKETMRKDYVKTLLLNWTIWPAAMFLNFRYLPVDYRVLGTNVTGLGWNTILSMIRYE
eukprot:CAMPEP_0201559534 /NCGR_PEP_ID=MMETSP0173_2-20130828/74695_1 /ASSEMBLY_ACC=CAM_ASM_000268 /TAXON_ID=218659 /ORGANISM="Vexillifera sp., Strain DIVA3 564/2" /LENGTH=133 /DNA_ID=CAMNT_0047973619 /DNA_START=173 /DNA_END=574 /DNA_ORIENTATION=+